MASDRHEHEVRHGMAARDGGRDERDGLAERDRVEELVHVADQGARPVRRLASDGADVAFTYNTGKAEADEVPAGDSQDVSSP